MARIAQFSLSFSCNPGDSIEVWGHSTGVTSEDYEKDPSIDPYFIHDSYTMSDTEPHWYWFTYDEERGYVAAVYVNGVRVVDRTIAPVVFPEVTIERIDTNYRSISIYLANVIDVYGISAYINTTGGTSSSASITYYNDNTARVYFDELRAGTLYSISIYDDDSLVSEITISTLSYPTFEWDTTIAAGVSMVVNGRNISPITAVEWNRFLDLYNLKKNTTYSHVSKGDTFSVKTGTTPRIIADDLGVEVHSVEHIKAQFFIDLKNALNALK